MRASARAAGVGAVLLAACALEATAQTDPVGTWNFETRNIAQRATGGVRNVLLKVERVDGALRAQMTSPRNTFMDVTEFEWDAGRMVVRFGAYLYEVELEGDSGEGTMTSPVTTVGLIATRQTGSRYGGDGAEAWVSTRTGFLGHATELTPPDGTEDPVEWVRSRVDSVDDLALILRGIPVSFANAADFEAQLMAYAGRRVSINGEWVGERYRINTIELASGADEPLQPHADPRAHRDRAR